MGLAQERVQERIQEILSDLLFREVRDPNLKGVTVTEVTIDPELVYARVYVNALGNESREKKVMKALSRANGYLRRQVAQRLRLRRAPELQFFWDSSLQKAEEMHRLINNLEIPPEEEDETNDTDSLE